MSVIVCAHNEAAYLAGCLYSLLAQSRPADEILVINNASTDRTRAVAQQVPHVRVVDEPRKGLVVARETGRLAANGNILVYLDADCRAPLTWLERIERHFARDASLIALTAPYRFYDWDWWGRLLIGALRRPRSCSSNTSCGSVRSSTAATSPSGARRWSGMAVSTPRIAITDHILMKKDRAIVRMRRQYQTGARSA